MHSVRIVYVPGSLSVSYDGAPLFTTPYSFASGGTWIGGASVGGLNLIGGSSLYVGVTSATGGAWEHNDVLSWSFTAPPPTPTTICTSGTSTHGCLATIGGSVSACNGSFTLDWNAFQAATPGALGQPWSTGQRSQVQAWYRDPPASKSTNWSNALTLTCLP
ncbi:MAG: hypothetical protein FJ298_05320 [Planctomycetes bacterium]|nr:hypothetical protein [Planctomycetota bacterium]